MIKNFAGREKIMKIELNYRLEDSDHPLSLRAGPRSQCLILHLFTLERVSLEDDKGKVII